MLTRSDLEAMSPDAQTQLFESLAETFYGTSRNGPMIERDFGISRPTVFAWRRNNNTPWAVLYTLDRWTNSEEIMARRFLEDMASVPTQLADIATGMSRLAATFSTLARRMPAHVVPAPSPEALPQPVAECQQSDEAHTAAE